MPGTPASSRAGLLTELFDSTLAADTASIDTGAGGFSTSLDHLLLTLYARTSQAATVFSSGSVTFNNDSAANYDVQQEQGREATLSASAGAGLTSFGLQLPGASVAANVFGAWTCWILNYGQTTGGHKTLTAHGGWAEATLANDQSGTLTARWRSTAAISRIIIAGAAGSNLLAGSRLTVYGIG